ncbi:MAG: hypothetical protein HKP03_02505 [Xanthomonadales bacterium]|nr:hypothetical protein [Gammaproteobacteria bacterium]NNK37326.1 hypothetical protein [Xanthomonadales bacterium]
MKSFLPVALAAGLLLPAQPAAGADPKGLTEASEFQVLLIGNSHSSRHGLPELLAETIRAGLPGASVHAEAAPRWKFLDERIDDEVTARALESRNWTHVILQAQKYSTSGRYAHPTDATEAWIRRVRVRRAAPILFPEWGRRGENGEGLRVHRLHMGIAEREPACIAPVGLAWEIVSRRNPSIRLHEYDGNHSNPAGALLTALVLYQTVTGRSAERLPPIESVRVKAAIQETLRRAAGEAHRVIPQEPGLCKPAPADGGEDSPAPDDAAQERADESVIQ